MEIKFEDAWQRTGYQYGDDALQNVKLGWDLAIKYLIRSEDINFRCYDCKKLYNDKPSYCYECDSSALMPEWKNLN